MSRFDEAKELYAGIGVDVEEALAQLGKVRVSMHCWQGDDVTGFESAGGPDGGSRLSGIIPGRRGMPMN